MKVKLKVLCIFTASKNQAVWHFNWKDDRRTLHYYSIKKCF